eukprot:jgi/Tetstr1/456507/TSEL_043229.t1
MAFSDKKVGTTRTLAKSAFTVLLLLQVATIVPTATALEDGSRIGLISDANGNAVARCRNCVADGAKPDTVFVHVPAAQLESSLFAQWDVTELSNGKIALRSADTGLYMSRCNGCGSASLSNSVTVHIEAADLEASPFAQFDLVSQPSGRIALRADTGQFLALCEDCWDNVARTGPGSDQHFFVFVDGIDFESSSSAGTLVRSIARFDVVYIGGSDSSSSSQW